MKRQQYLIGNIEGPDADIETSLKEYGLAWIEADNDILFYYAISHNNAEYIRFDFCSFPKNTNWRKEFDWADFDEVENFIGYSLGDEPLQEAIQALLSYYGYEEIFGSSYWEGLTYQQIMMNW